MQQTPELFKTRYSGLMELNDLVGFENKISLFASQPQKEKVVEQQKPLPNQQRATLKYKRSNVQTDRFENTYVKYTCTPGPQVIEGLDAIKPAKSKVILPHVGKKVLKDQTEFIVLEKHERARIPLIICGHNTYQQNRNLEKWTNCLLDQLEHRRPCGSSQGLKCQLLFESGENL